MARTSRSPGRSLAARSRTSAASSAVPSAACAETGAGLRVRFGGEVGQVLPGEAVGEAEADFGVRGVEVGDAAQHVERLARLARAPQRLGRDEVVLARV